MNLLTSVDRTDYEDAIEKVMDAAKTLQAALTLNDMAGLDASYCLVIRDQVLKGIADLLPPENREI